MHIRVLSHPFPPISWWLAVGGAEQVDFVQSSLYRKDRPQNRYRLTGSQGPQLLSIPLLGGRNQSILQKDVRIAYAENWPAHHWKTIQSMYRQSPFFEFYEAELAAFYQRRPAFLEDWNQESVRLAGTLLKISVSFGVAAPEGDADRGRLQAAEANARTLRYRQVFEDKVGFQPDCSILDLLFCEGPHGRRFLGAL